MVTRGIGTGNTMDQCTLHTHVTLHIQLHSLPLQGHENHHQLDDYYSVSREQIHTAKIYVVVGLCFTIFSPYAFNCMQGIPSLTSLQSLSLLKNVATPGILHNFTMTK